MTYGKSPGDTPYDQSPGATPYEAIPGARYAASPGATPYEPVPAGTVATAPPLDAFTTAPRAAYDMHQCVLSSYTGALHTIRKTTGGDTVTTHDVPYGADNLFDAADRAAFVGAQSWAVTRLLDQCAGARHLTQATGSAQPVGGTAGTGVAVNGRAAADYDLAVSQRLSRGDALGLSGARALTVFCEVRANAVAPSRAAWGIGNNGIIGQTLELLFNSGTSVFVSIAGANCGFTCPDVIAAPRKFLAALDAGAGVGTARLWCDGVELSQVSSVNPTNTLNLATNFTTVGGRSNYSGTSGWDGPITRCYFWDAYLPSSASDLAKALAL